MRFAREQVQAAAIAGSTTRAPEDLVRIGRLITRLEATLRQVKAARAERPMTLSDYLAMRNAGDAAAAEEEPPEPPLQDEADRMNAIHGDGED